MTAKTGAQRQASLKARRKAAGLVEVKVWVHPDHAQELKKIAATMYWPKPVEWRSEWVELTYSSDRA